jgi:hypothetical protein
METVFDGFYGFVLWVCRLFSFVSTKGYLSVRNLSFTEARVSVVFGKLVCFSFPITIKTVEEEPSVVFSDFLQANHQHLWRFAQGSPYYCFGTKWGGCAIGGGRHQSEIATLYQIDDEFRAYVSNRMAADLTRESVYRLLIENRYSEQNDEEKAAITQSAKQLMEDYYSKR